MSAAAPTITVDLGGELVQAEVVRSSGVRVTRIQVGADRPLRVVVPAGASDEFAADALRAKGAWVARKLRAVEDARGAAPTLGLDRPGVVWVAGRPLQVAVVDVRFAHEHDGVLRVPNDETARAAIQRWYRRRARTYLRELVAEEAARLGSTVASVAVRDQRTRWGSCSANGTISLNWRLLLVPEPAARYVVIHELVHLEVPNHSKAFWRALTAAQPEWQEQAAWWREHGGEVRRYQQ